MTLQDIRSECSDTATLLQPYVDGELASAEQERVAAHLECCRPCRAAVSEQQWVRATLRAVKREVAPAALRIRISAELDEVDRERVHSTPPARSLWHRIGSALADAGRGAMIMVPAGAVAVGLFFVARDGFAPARPMSGALGSALTQLHGTASDDAPAPGTGPVTRPGATLPPLPAADLGELQLVRADLPGIAPEAPGARLRYQVIRGGQPTGQHVVDHQAPVGLSASGTRVEFRGRQFLVDQTPVGEPLVRFDLAGVSHNVVLEGGQHDQDFSILLELVEQNFRRVDDTP